EGEKAVLELAHLVGGADQDRYLVELLASALQLLDLLADRARFLLGIPGAGDGDLLAVDILGAQRLAEPAFIVRDQIGGGGEDVAGRAIVALEAGDFRAGEIVVEAQDVCGRGGAAALERVVVVADAPAVLWRARA